MGAQRGGRIEADLLAGPAEAHMRLGPVLAAEARPARSRVEDGALEGGLAKLRLHLRLGSRRTMVNKSKSIEAKLK